MTTDRDPADPAGRTDPADPAGRTHLADAADRTDRAGLAVPLGVLSIVAGLALNPWFFTAIAPDGDIESRVILAGIVAFDLILLGFGAWLLRARPRIHGRDVALTAASLLFVLVLIEAGFRLGLTGERDGTLRLTDTLGWEPKPHHERLIADHPVYGEVRYTSTRDGFRRFGDPEAKGTKILFLGDSYTQAIQVPDGEAFYDHMARQRSDLEVFAYGAGGYGSLQEYMVLDRFFDEIGPDLIVWQFTPNDIMNNSYELESRSAYNSRMRRPYLDEEGRVAHRFPSRNPLVRYSRLGRFISIRLGFIGAANTSRRQSSIEYRIPETRDLWDDAVRATETIMRRVRERAGDVPVVAFEVGPSYLDDELFPEICDRAGILFVPGVREALDSAEAAGTPIDFSPHDGHWNSHGHAVAGERILRFLVDREMLSAREEA